MNNDPQQAKHLEYSDRSKRLLSFANWPFSRVQDPTKLANCGFFYTEDRDLVRCHYCSLGLKDFIQTDDPLLEHVRYSGEKCGFLIQLLGSTRLTEIKEGMATGTTFAKGNSTVDSNQLHNVTRETPGEDNIELTRSHQDQPKFIDLAASKPHTIYRHLRYLRLHNVSSRTSTTAIIAVIESLSEMGFKHADIHQAIRALSRNKTHISIGTVIDKIEKNRSEVESQINQPEDIQLLLCMNCKRANINVMFLPCQHQRFCTTCADSLTVCTVCGRSIAHKIKT